MKILLPDLRDLLSDIGSKLANGRRVGPEAKRIAHLFRRIDPVDLPRAASEITAVAGLWPWRPERSIIARILGRGSSDIDQIRSVEGLEYLFIFHGNGHLREAALRKLSGALPNAFLFAAIAWRLNDWVAPVRQAAADCAMRVFPETQPDIVAEAAVVLLSRQATWGRWGSERIALETAFTRADVGSHLAQMIAMRRTGPMASLLRQTFRSGMMDAHLEHLAAEAVQPAVRAVAVQALINGYAEWADGWHYRWIDKSLGRRRRENTFAKRPIEVSTNRTDLIRRGLVDRAAAVRNVAISSLIEYHAEVADARSLAATMLADKSAAVRERAEFIINRMALP